MKYFHLNLKKNVLHYTIAKASVKKSQANIKCKYQAKQDVL